MQTLLNSTHNNLLFDDRPKGCNFRDSGRCFPVNFVKFLGRTFGDCFWIKFVNAKKKSVKELV